MISFLCELMPQYTGACIVDHSSHSRTSNIDKGGKQFGAPTTMLSNFPKRKILKPQTYQV